MQPKTLAVASLRAVLRELPQMAEDGQLLEHRPAAITGNEVNGDQRRYVKTRESHHIVAEARANLAALRRAGWTREDFARALALELTEVTALASDNTAVMHGMARALAARPALRPQP